jgi:hypothetical protein
MNLEIYFTIDNNHISDKIKDEIRETCRLYTHQQGYTLVKFKEYYSHKYYSKVSEDAIKKGICVLNEMTMYLKFKSTNNIWFLYISTGNTFDSVGNLFKCNIFLLNRNINTNVQTCNYLIKEHIFNIYFRDYLMELFTTNHSLNYSNVFEKNKNEC